MPTDSAEPGPTSGAELWATKLDVVACLVDYVTALDDRRFADAGHCFTADGVLTFGGEERIVGPAAVTEATSRDLGALDLTQHTVSTTVVTLLAGSPDGIDARLRAGAIGAHRWTEDGEPRQSVMGGRYDAELSLTPDGWRLARLQPQFLWTVGDTWEH